MIVEVKEKLNIEFAIGLISTSPRDNPYIVEYASSPLNRL